MKIALFGVKGMPYPGGIEHTCEQLGPLLVQQGHEVIVYVRPSYTQEVLSEYKGMRIVVTKGIRSKHCDALTHTATATMDALSRGVDLFFYHSIGLAPFCAIPRLFGKKSILQIHGLDWEREKWGSFAKVCLKGAERCAMTFPHKTFAVSRNNVSYYREKYNGEVVYLPNGANEFTRRPPDKIERWKLSRGSYILFASRLVPEKGAHYLIDAYRNIETDKKLVIAGDASVHDDYYRHLKSFGSGKIIFTGFATGELLEELYSNAAFFVQPSDIEGLSNSVLSAMSARLCVLSSDVLGNAELTGDCGLMFRQGDRADLEGKLRFLLDNPKEAEEMGGKAAQLVKERYQWDAIAEQLHQEIMKLKSQ